MRGTLGVVALFQRSTSWHGMDTVGALCPGRISHAVSEGPGRHSSERLSASPRPPQGSVHRGIAGHNLFAGGGCRLGFVRNAARGGA